MTIITTKGYIVTVSEHAWEIADESGNEMVARYGFKNIDGSNKSVRYFISKYGRDMYGDII